MSPVERPQTTVALRKESVDRNKIAQAHHALTRVALRKESVDRNDLADYLTRHGQQSLSARRAWIEIRPHVTDGHSAASLSARRAWIEMPY